MSGLPLQGGCLCGGVRYEIGALPISASYCHCTRCQRRTGSAASAQARLQPGSLHLVSGEDLVTWYDPGDGWHKAFCSTCGSALFSRHPTEPERMSVRLGSLDPGHGITPDWHQFVASAALWEPIPDDGLPRYADSA